MSARPSGIIVTFWFLADADRYSPTILPRGRSHDGVQIHLAPSLARSGCVVRGTWPALEQPDLYGTICAFALCAVRLTPVSADTRVEMVE